MKDEAWILERFLACAATWADHIVIADQHSTDGSREVAAAHPKVTLVDNDCEAYDEGARQRLLIDAARAIPAPGRRVLIALDADEVLSANWRVSAPWAAVEDTEPGTVLAFHWMNLTPDGRRGWPSDGPIPFGYVDDGAEHGGEPIHSRRLPTPAAASVHLVEDVFVLHLQYLDWNRMRSKQRWYQCWERLRYPDKRPVTLYRQYHHMDAAVERAEPVDPGLLASYEEAGIDLRAVVEQPYYRWDEELLALFAEHGAEPFRRLDVWDVDWSEIARETGRAEAVVKDPRSTVDRHIMTWLARTQARADHYSTRACQQVLRLWGW